MENLDQIKSDVLAAVEAATESKALEDIRVSALGKKGSITSMMKDMKSLSPEERKEIGQKLNIIKDEISQALDERKTTLDDAELNERLMSEKIDVSLSVRPESEGSLHPVSQTIDEAIAIFGEMGFTVAEGPNIEDDWRNFGALNIPPEHPARQDHDTFYMPREQDGNRMVLRTHTSPVQIRSMQEKGAPIRIICPGRTYRCDYDATHTPMFHQIEGLVIDEKTHFGHLKGCLIDFCRSYFGVDELPVRFRPSYFPFTEPSAEVDIGCSRAGGEFKIGAGEDWLEILGCGMVHPKVLENCGIDSTKYQGFAFGVGVERIAMLKYGIPDLRTFYESDLRWLRHYGFKALDIPSMVGGLTR